MEHRLYYFLSNGHVVDRNAIEMAFMVCHGYCPEPDDAKFLNWLYGRLGYSIVRVATAIDFTPDDLKRLANNYSSVMAIKIYRDQTECSLREAKEHIDSIRGENNR